MRYTHLISYFALLMFLLSFAGCNKDKEEEVSNYSLGETSYRPSFLWSDADSVSIVKKLKTNFNDQAKQDGATASILFVDENMAPIKGQDYKIYTDGEEVSDRGINLHADINEIAITITPSANTEEGSKSGYLVLIDKQNLDRVIDANGNIIAKWNFKHHIAANPLKVGLETAAALTIITLLLWFILLRRMIYRAFSTMAKTVYFNNTAPIIIRFGGAIRVVIDNRPHKQPIFEKIFKGKIIYFNIPEVVSPIEFIPTRRGGALIKTVLTDYKVSPNPMPKTGDCNITNRETGVYIKIR